MAVDDLRLPVAQDARQPAGRAPVVGLAVKCPHRHRRIQAVGHFAARVQTHHGVFEVRRGQAIEHVDDPVLEAAPWQAVNHLQNP